MDTGIPPAAATHAGHDDAPPDGPHLLYIAWGFPPGRSGGVYRALATANAFAEQGWRVTVLTADRETFERHTGTDPGLEARVDPRIDVVRIPFSWPYREEDRSRWSRTRRMLPRVWWKARVALDQVPFPEQVYGPWRRPLERAAERIHAARPVDLAVATANPSVAFTAAARLHARHGVPYVMDYRDAWLLDVFDGHQLHSDSSRPARWERRLIEKAAEVWFVNEPIRAWHARRYADQADRMHVVANGYDPGLAPEPRLAAPGEDPLRFGYIGTISPKVPVQQFADGWARARATCPDLDKATADLYGYLGYYSTPNPELLALIEAHAEDGIAYRGPLPKDAVAATYADLDALLLILGTGLYVTSGKVFEYLASALPIVSVHDPDNAASSVLEGYPLWFPAADLTAASIESALCDAAAAARSADIETREACRAFAQQYARERQLGPRVSALRERVAARRGRPPRS